MVSLHIMFVPTWKWKSGSNKSKIADVNSKFDSWELCEKLVPTSNEAIGVHCTRTDLSLFLHACSTQVQRLQV